MSEHQFPKLCPDCKAIMIDDAWEIIDILPNGNIEQNIIYPAWVCSKWCGFYLKI